MPEICLGWEEKHETVRYLYNMYTVYDMYKDLVSLYLGSTGPLEWKITSNSERLDVFSFFHFTTRLAPMEGLQACQPHTMRTRRWSIAWGTARWSISRWWRAIARRTITIGWWTISRWTISWWWTIPRWRTIATIAGWRSIATIAGRVFAVGRWSIAGWWWRRSIIVEGVLAEEHPSNR